MRCYICDTFTNNRCMLCNRYVCTACSEDMICKRCNVKHEHQDFKDDILLISGLISIIVGFLMIALGSIDTNIDIDGDSFIYIFPFIFIKLDPLFILPLLILFLLLPLLFMFLFIRKIM